MTFRMTRTALTSMTRVSIALLSISALCGLTLSAGPAETERTGRNAVGPQPIAGMFLVANPSLEDSNFGQTIVLIVSHGPHGAMGLIVNRPTDKKLGSFLPEDAPPARGDDTLYLGGPVAMSHLSMLLRTDDDPVTAKRIVDNVFFSRDPELLVEFRRKRASGRAYRVYTGYAGWSAGQLEEEIERGDWSLIPATAQDVFDERPATLWRDLAPKDPGSTAEAVPESPSTDSVRGA